MASPAEHVPNPATSTTLVESSANYPQQEKKEASSTAHALPAAAAVPPETDSAFAVFRAGAGPEVEALRQRHRAATNVGVSCLHTSGLQKEGQWLVPRYLTVYIMLSGGSLDMTYAEFVHPRTDVYVYALLGGYEITAPRGVRVETTGGALCGGVHRPKDGGVDPLLPQSPLVVVHTYILLGGATVAVNRLAPTIRIAEA